MHQSDIKYDTPTQPRQVRLDTVARCNAECVSCHRFLSKRNGEMPLEQVMSILEDISRWPKPLTEIVPVNYGEFFLYSHWLMVLKTIERKLPQTQIVIPTNGSMFNPDVCSQLCEIKNLRIINFSVNAFFEDTYEQFMGLKASNLKNIESSIKRIHILRQDINVWVSMVFDPSFCSDLQRDLFISYWKQWATPQILPAASAGRGTIIKIPRIFACRSIFSDIVIGFDGKLSSCCFDPSFSAFDLGYYSGNLLKDWHSDKFQEFRKLHNEGRRQEIELCKNCTFE